jgi:hypothetical protein
MSLTADKICKIIETSKNNNVSDLEIVSGSDRVRIVFATKPIVAENSTSHAQNVDEVASDDSQFKPVEIKFTKETSPDVEDVEQQLEELSITDPTAYEEMISRGELVSGRRKREGIDDEEENDRGSE